MDRSIFLARVLGAALALIGFSIVLRADHVRDILKAFDGNPALLYLAGLAALSVGLAIVIGHNVWTLNWRILVTLIGWVALVKGIVILFAPLHMGALGDRIVAAPDALLGSGIFDGVLGLILAACGFLARSPQKP